MSGQTVTWRLWVDWGRNGVWRDESARLASASGSLMAAAPGEALTGGAGMADSVQITLLDPDRRYDPDNADSPLHAFLTGGNGYQAPFYLEISTDEPLTPFSLRRLITGVVRPPRSQATTTRALGSAGLTWLSRLDLLRERTLSTELREAYDEASNIQFALEAAGFENGADFCSRALWAAHGSDPVWRAAHPLVDGPTLDPGMQTIPAFWLDDEAIWGDLSDMAAASLGIFGCNAAGLFTYQNAANWYFRQTPALVLTRSDFQEYETWYADEQLWGKTVVEYTPLARLDTNAIWESDEVVVVGPGQSVSLTATYRQPAVDVQAPTAGVDFEAVTAGGSLINEFVHVTMMAYAQRAELTIVNNHGWRQAYLVGLQLRGAALDSQRGQEITETSTNVFWATRQAVTRRFDGVYIQSRAQASLIAQLARDRHGRPLRMHHVRGVLGLPALRVGDLVAIDPLASGGLVTPARRLAHVVEIAWRLGPAGFFQDLTCVDREGFFAADTTYFVLGMHRMGNSGAERGRMFY